MASSSAAIVLPTADSLRLSGPDLVDLLPQVAVADSVCIVLLPLVIDTAHVVRAAVGAVVVIAAGVVLFLLLRQVEAGGIRARVHRVSEDRQFAVELRVSLAAVFAMAALAVAVHVSLMLAGFVSGLAVAAVGEPRRVAKQLFAITEGFFGPLFFVWLGASLQVRELGEHPGLILLGLGLGLGALLAHGVGRLFGQPLTLAVLSAAQLGVPVAAATLGTEQHLLAPGEPSALMLGALVTVLTTSVAGAVAARRQSADESKPPSG
jgi:Kef-type K+ transport system membrane component KefB